MPTYEWICPRCQRVHREVMSMRAYCEATFDFTCHGLPMQRLLSAPAVLMTSDAAYTNLRAPDGSDISTRTKHRQYLREHNLATIDDFTETWKRDAAERAQRLEGHDPSRRSDIVEAIHQLDHST